MAEDNRTETDLDTLFAAARDDRPDPSSDLTLRVLADAAAVQDALTRPASLPRRAGPGRWRQLVATLGGWPGLGGLAAAGIAGIWLGIAPPATLPDPVGLVQEQFAAAEMDVLGDADFAFALTLED